MELFTRNYFVYFCVLNIYGHVSENLNIEYDSIPYSNNLNSYSNLRYKYDNNLHFVIVSEYSLCTI